MVAVRIAKKKSVPIAWRVVGVRPDQVDKYAFLLRLISCSQVVLHAVILYDPAHPWGK
jgi:hypothetical protein